MADGHEAFSKRGELDSLVVNSPSGAAAELLLQGAQVLSFADPQGRELLFMGGNASYCLTKPVRGGVPVIFPQFGPGPLPQHGLVRTMTWRVKDRVQTASGSAVTLEVSDTEETRALWPYAFHCLLEIGVDRSLSFRWEVINTGKDLFNFANALHTYFAVGDIRETAVVGLQGVEYLRLPDKQPAGRGTLPELRFDGPIDRLYRNAPNLLQIRDRNLGRIVEISREGFADVVVWNPWGERCASYEGLAEGDYRKFICVESANAAAPITIRPGETLEFRQEISILQ
jgi:glucose-6-phosphate 1-epimerase